MAWINIKASYNWVVKVAYYSFEGQQISLRACITQVMPRE